MVSDRKDRALIYGGDRWSVSGTTGLEERSIVMISGGEVELTLVGGPHDAGEHLLGVGAVAGTISDVNVL